MTRFLLPLVLLSGMIHDALAQGEVRGRVMDKTTRQPLEFVSVALFAGSDSTAVGGTLTDTTGAFRLLNLRPGAYRLSAYFVGYRPATMPVTVAGTGLVELPPLALEPTARQLDEVRVLGQKANVTVKADRQTYRAGQFQAATGGTATDVLRNLPGLSVNAEGEVALRGSAGFLVLLNGKPVQANLGTLLAQLPANTIEAIEVITTPNARYDPDGKGGIISIVTKAGTDRGWSALVNAQGGLPSLDDFGNARKPLRFGTDATVNFRSARWDVTLSTAFLRNDLAGRRVGDVSTTRGNRFTRFPSVGERSFDRYTFTNRLALAFSPTKTDAFTAGLYYGQRTEDRLADLVYDNTTTDLRTGRVIGRSTYFNNNLVRKRGQFFTANLDYTRTFRNKATLNLGGLYEYDYLDGFTSNRNLNRFDYRDTLQYTLTTTERPIGNARFNLDAGLPLAGGRLETGYQFRSQRDAGTYRYQEQQGNDAPLALVPEFSGLVRIDNVIHSLYGQYALTRKALDVTAGLRYEYSRRTLRAPGNQAFDLTLNNLFPSFNLLYKAPDGLSLKAGYSRRVQRTSNFALNPLPEREHSETLEQGDPNLLPEFVSLAELGATKALGSSTLLATLYFQDTQNIINRVNRVYADTILSRIFTNAGRARRFGIELAADLALTKRWKLYAGGTLYRYAIDGQLFQGAVIFRNAAWVYSLNANSSLQLAPTLTLQANLSYLSRRLTAQGEDSRFLLPSLSLRKSYLNQRLSVLVQWQNMGLGFLPSNEQRITTRGADFFTTTNYIQERDVFLINLSYSFRQLSKRAKLPTSEMGDKEF